MEFFIEYNSVIELKKTTKIDTFPELVSSIKQLKKEKGEEMYYQVYVRDVYGNYCPIELDVDDIRWEEI